MIAKKTLWNLGAKSQPAASRWHGRVESKESMMHDRSASGHNGSASGQNGSAGHLRLQGVTKYFAATDTPVLSDITLECKPGEFVVVVGPSGCGKTTLLNVAAGMVLPDSGAVSLDGADITGPGPRRAMVFQDHGLFPWLTARQNVAFGLKMAGVSRGDRLNRADEALRLVHLATSGNKLVHELSGGMRQRVAIARALVMNPDVLLMDEPFASLDAQTRTQMHQNLQDLWCETKKTILFVTHSVGEAVRLGDRIIVLHAHPGRIRAEFAVDLPHPRDVDGPALSELARRVRKEIEDEVNRANAASEEFWKPQATRDLGGASGGMGDGI